MIEEDRLVSAEVQPAEDRIDRTVRPKTLADYVGQPTVREQMGIFIQAAKLRDEALDHTLVFGPPGLGKTTLANIIAGEMGVDIKTTSGPVLEKAGDVAALLTNHTHRCDYSSRAVDVSVARPFWYYSEIRVL